LREERRLLDKNLMSGTWQKREKGHKKKNVIFKPRPINVIIEKGDQQGFTTSEGKKREGKNKENPEK